MFNLVFAIGLTLATPTLNSSEAHAVNKLRNCPYSQADVFFSNAKGFADPSTGFEDADIESVQALVLMTVYMLTISKRNAAYAYIGTSRITFISSFIDIS